MSKKSVPPAAGKPPSGTVSTATSGGPMDVGLLEQMVRLMAANDLNTVDVRDGDRRVILKRGAVAVHTATPVPQQVPTAPPVQSPPPPSKSAPPAPVDETAGLVPIKSPMVGTFYSSPSPDAKPFVQVGTTVDEETDVCMVEAMKTFSNIKAETRGTIAKVLVANGATVQFGTLLFLVKP